jgi:hypothetical protein
MEHRRIRLMSLVWILWWRRVTLLQSIDQGGDKVEDLGRVSRGEWVDGSLEYECGMNE